MDGSERQILGSKVLDSDSLRSWHMVRGDNYSTGQNDGHPVTGVSRHGWSFRDKQEVPDDEV